MQPFAPAARIRAFIRTQLPCFLWVVLALAAQGFTLSEAVAEHFEGFAGLRDQIGGAIQTTRIPILLPSQKCYSAS